jgi:hypothetical protein
MPPRGASDADFGSQLFGEALETPPAPPRTGAVDAASWDLFGSLEAPPPPAPDAAAAAPPSPLPGDPFGDFAAPAAAAPDAGGAAAAAPASSDVQSILDLF